MVTSHNNSPRTRPRTDAELRSSVLSRYHEDANGCWLWAGKTDVHGYGLLAHDGKIVRAHRVAYSLMVGDIPAGLYVCHKCDVPRCINPAHLFVGTQSDNIRDCAAKGRHARAGGRPMKPEVLARCKAAIEAYQRGEGTQAEMARRHGVHQSQISSILTGRYPVAMSTIKEWST